MLTVLIFATYGAALGAQNFQPNASANAESEFGMISLEAGQTLRFNGINIGMADGSVRVLMKFEVYSLGGPDTSPGCNPGSTVAACTNNLRWIKTETCRVNLRSRAAAACEITSDRPGLLVSVSMLVETAGGKILPSLEVRENNRTLFVHPGAVRGFDPQPEPPVQQ